MTKELAIRILTGDVLGTTEQTKEAVTMAVRALSQQNVTDTNVGDIISKQAAIDAINRLDIPEDMCVFEILSHIALAIGTLPSAQPEQRWIPCSLRLPKDLVGVNVTWVNHNPEPYYDFLKDKPFTDTAVYYKGKWYWWSSVCEDLLAEYGQNEIDEVDKNIDIIAWMPLPRPYKAERRVNEQNRIRF